MRESVGSEVEAMHALSQLSQPVSDEDLTRVSRGNAAWRFERDESGALVVSPPAGASGDGGNAESTYQLVAHAQRCGGVAFGSSAGFTLPDRSVRSPDGAWIAAERWNGLAAARRAGFAPIGPDVWIELRSRTDTVAELRRKLGRVRTFGARYVVFIDPVDGTAWSDGVAPDGLVLDFTAIFAAAA